MEMYTSEDVMISAFQSIRGKMLMRSFGFNSMLSWTSSASLGCKGKDWLEDLQAFTAQVKKLRVRTFIVTVVFAIQRGIVVECLVRFKLFLS